MNKKTKGIIFIICAAFCFSLMNTFVKLSGDIPPLQKSFFRNFVAFFVSLAILKSSDEKIKYSQKSNLPFLIARAVFGTAGIFFNFYSIDNLILSDSSMLGKLSPFFAIIASFFILKERVTPFQVLSIIIAFIGSLFIIKPSGSLTASLPALSGILGAAFAGLAYTMVRLLGERGEKGSFIVLFFSGFSCLFTLPYLIFNYQPMTGKQIFYLLMAGVAATGGQFSVTNAYINAPAKEISVYDYTQVIFAAITGLIIYSEVPDAHSFIGYAIICGIGIATFLINKKEYGITSNANAAPTQK